FQQHLRSITKWTYLRSFAVIHVLDWHLENLEPELAGQKKRFRVESPARNFLNCKSGLGRFARERFEAVLRIRQIQTEQRSESEVVNSAVQPAIPGLRRRLQFSIDPSRADHYVSSLRNAVDQFFRFLDWSRVISIRKQHDISRSSQYTVSNRTSLSGIHRLV